MSEIKMREPGFDQGFSMGVRAAAHALFSEALGTDNRPLLEAGEKLLARIRTWEQLEGSVVTSAIPKSWSEMP
jgi:hypothetical protein